MHCRWRSLLIWLALLMLVHADQVMPPCGMECTALGISNSTCAPTDQLCICTNQALNADIARCVKARCTIREQLATKNVSSTDCHAPIRDRTGLIWGFGIGCGLLAAIFYGLRIVSRLTMPGGRFGADDYTITAAMIALIVFSGLAAKMAAIGFGRDVWTVTFNDIQYILLIYFIEELLYISIVSLTKLSILFLYLRIFPSRPFRRIVYIVIALVLAYMVAFLLASIFQCLPIHRAWTGWDDPHSAGHCNNVNAQGWSAAGINIALDLAVLALPIRQILHLHLNTTKKIQLLIMFGVGIFVTVASIIRLSTIANFATSDNLTWKMVPFGYWSAIELGVGVVCACMPALAGLASRVVYGKSTKEGSGGSGSGGSGGSGSGSSSQPGGRAGSDWGKISVTQQIESRSSKRSAEMGMGMGGVPVGDGVPLVEISGARRAGEEEV